MAISQATTVEELRSALSTVEEAMNNATVASQLAFWIESARESLQRFETFFSVRPHLQEEARAAELLYPDWGPDQSEGLLWLHNQLIGMHQETKSALGLTVEAQSS